MFVMATTREGKKIAIAVDAIRSIEEAADKVRQDDLRVRSVILSEMTGKLMQFLVQESFDDLMTQLARRENL